MREDCEELQTKITRNNGYTMAILLKKQRIAQAKAIYGRQLDEKLQAKGFLGMKMGQILREKEEGTRRILEDIYNLGCHYVSETEYKSEMAKGAVVESWMKSVGLVVVCAIQATAFMVWAF